MQAPPHPPAGTAHATPGSTANTAHRQATAPTGGAGPLPPSHQPPTHQAPQHPTPRTSRPLTDDDADPKAGPAKAGWFGRHENALAPWLQAIATAAAIMAAFTIGSFEYLADRSAADGERQARADVLTYTVRYELLNLKKSFEPILAAQQNQSSAPDKLLGLALYIPPNLTTNGDGLYLLGRDQGVAVQKALADAQRVAFLLDFVRKDADAYAAFYAKRGLNEETGAGTAVYFNAKALDTAIFALNNSLNGAFRALKISDRDTM